MRIIKAENSYIVHNYVDFSVNNQACSLHVYGKTLSIMLEEYMMMKDERFIFVVPQFLKCFPFLKLHDSESFPIDRAALCEAAFFKRNVLFP